MEHTRPLPIAAAILAVTAAQARPRFFVSGNQASATVMDDRQPRYIRLGTESSGWYGSRVSVHIAYSNLLTHKRKGLYHTHEDSVSPARFDEIGGLPLIRRLFDGIVNRDDNGVTVTHLYRIYGPIYRYVPGGIPNDYSNLSRMSFVRVGSADAYPSDWANMQPGVVVGTAGADHSILHNGTGKTAKMLTSGTATYSAKGINHYVDANTVLLTSGLKTDFAKKGLNGTIKRPGLNVTVNNVVISTTNASFGGRAAANGVSGTARDDFHGNDVAALAGVVEFARNLNLNTAFGGTKE